MILLNRLLKSPTTKHLSTAIKAGCDLSRPVAHCVCVRGVCSVFKVKNHSLDHVNKPNRAILLGLNEKKKGVSRLALAFIQTPISNGSVPLVNLIDCK